MFRLLTKFGWYKGDYFHNWIAELIANKTGDRNATFADLQTAGCPELFLAATNLSTGFSNVFSHENTPDFVVADAVRLSMSMPLFFRAERNARGDVFVDGGVLDNYPVKLFDRLKYIAEKDRPALARHTDYYERENRRFLKLHPQSSPYVFNRQTLGFRLDSKEEIAMFCDGKEAQHTPIDNFVAYATALIETLLESQSNQHLHSDDWNRTIYIDTLGVSTTDFDINETMKNKLIESGRSCTEAYFAWLERTADTDSDGGTLKMPNKTARASHKRNK